ncbi:MAG: glycosyltransferase [Pseudomonadota bacterium]
MLPPRAGAVARVLFGRSNPKDGTARPIPIFGAMRFSALLQGNSGFRQMHDLELQERAALLFAPERMDMRFRFFEAMALPSLVAQDRDDWTFLIFYAETLPEPYRERLFDLVAPHDHITAISTEPHERLAMKLWRVMQRKAPREAERWVSFRLDDDDALASGFISALRAAIDGIGPGLSAITFPRGHVLGVDPAAGTFHLDENVKKFGIGCGLAVHSPRDLRRGAYNLGAVHRHVDNAMPTLSDARELMYIIGAHVHSDTGADSSRVTGTMKTPGLSAAEVVERLGPAFAHVDLPRLLR